jgi:hypothetical protein
MSCRLLYTMLCRAHLSRTGLACAVAEHPMTPRESGVKSAARLLWPTVYDCLYRWPRRGVRKGLMSSQRGYRSANIKGDGQSPRRAVGTAKA